MIPLITELAFGLALFFPVLICAYVLFTSSSLEKGQSLFMSLVGLLLTLLLTSFNLFPSISPLPITALCLPLISFIFLMCNYSILTRKQTAVIACLSVALSCLLFLSLLASYLYSGMIANTYPYFDWIPVEGINADFSLHIDSLSLLMSLIITGIGLLIHIYSAGYMEYEEDYVRYFACLNFFIFAMLLLVLANNLLLMFVGWEGVGLASYLLIGYDYYRKKAAQAATKAFVVNRIGDFGFLLGLLLTFVTFGTSDIPTITQEVASFPVGSAALTTIALLLFVGACGKSAQLPLHVWLADAMEGPTPVSALIHAATMVTAGVYLLVRMDVLYIQAPLALQVVGIVGAATALFAAIAAAGQTELKRVLAYSTISQLGFMFLACGAKAFYAAMFHLTVHAFIKALLFLSAGNILHMLHGVGDMRQMGGLKKFLPTTSWFFLIGVLALSGVPPLAAFFSKDLILEQEHLAGFNVLFDMGLIASTLTAFYMMRAYCLTFTGEPHLNFPSGHPPQEAPRLMLIPVGILAILSIFGGFLGFSSGATPILIDFLSPIGISSIERELSSHFHLSAPMLLTVGGGLLGLTTAVILYTRFYRKIGETMPLLHEAFYIDHLYDRLIVRPLKSLSRSFSYLLEPNIFQSSMRQIALITENSAKILQKVQSGQIRSYVAWMAITAAFLITLILKLVGGGANHA